MSHFNLPGSDFNTLYVGGKLSASQTDSDRGAYVKIIRLVGDNIVKIRDKQGVYIAIFCKARGTAFYERKPDATHIPRKVLALENGKPVMLKMILHDGIQATQRGTKTFQLLPHELYPWYHIGPVLEPLEEKHVNL